MDLNLLGLKQADMQVKHSRDRKENSGCRSASNLSTVKKNCKKNYEAYLHKHKSVLSYLHQLF